MNKTATRVLAVLLAAMMIVASFAACGNQGTTSSSPADSSTPVSSTPDDTSSTPEDEPTTWQAPTPPESDDDDEISSYYYDWNLGEFYEAYQAASAETTDLSKRYALMGIAEAKLIKSGVMLPNKRDGGNFAMGRLAPGSKSNMGWGTDDERYHNAIITTEIMTKEDRDHLVEMLGELKGTHTYEAEARKYLEEKGYTLKDSYEYYYVTDPLTLDTMASSRTTTGFPIANCLEGLLEYDGENNENPALAESYEVSDDGLTYTFKIRKGVKWVDNQGREVGEVKAQDWVDGLQHTVDCADGLADLFVGVIKGIDDYIADPSTDFANVGIKAVDDYTLEYTLVRPVPYFTTYLHYSISVPLCRSFYESKGGKFGADFDSSAEDYVYGSAPENIAYNGPFLITNWTEKNSITWAENPLYWNKENTTIKSIKWIYNDGTDALKNYKDCIAGTIDACGLNSSAVEEAKKDGYMDKNVYTTSTGTTAYMGWFNVRRGSWTNFNDENAVVSPQSEEERARTAVAMSNEHFRRALAMGFDRKSYNAQSVGDELAELSLSNGYVPGNFVSLSEEVTVEINGESKTYPAGTDIGQITQDQLDADGVKLTVYKLGASEKGQGTGDGFDGWYNPENAKAELELAIAELAAAGVTVDESNPIQIDYPEATYNPTGVNMAQVLKKSIEEALDGKVQVNLVSCQTQDQESDTQYNCETGLDCNYDLSTGSGWGPDYGDPSTYLDTMLPDHVGYMVRNLGIF